MPSPNIDKMFAFLQGLLNTPSPTGFAENAIAFTEQAFGKFPHLAMRRTRKGALLISWPGASSTSPRALTAHVDTLGAMVKEIKSNGRLQLSKLGGYAWNAVEGEGCTVFTRKGDQIRGSFLLNKASTHVFGTEVTKEERLDENMEVRLDARTGSSSETIDLGIEIGDFVAFDPRVELNNGFIRSRHLDDKACVATIFASVDAMIEAGKKPSQDTFILISNYEEVGHGASTGIPAEVQELLAVDMAAVGDGQNSSEFFASICVKDSGGPYHHAFSNRLRDLADAHHIPYMVDIYPYYGSDGEAFWRAGGDVAVALIGPGVDASHNYERTHTDALLATANWITAYLLSE
ncbi:MAG TPA: M42 family metallopeptidase [Anaerolineales bacterium]|nr:M42 family metallopeptidase [Anaerolineales bacterium]